MRKYLLRLDSRKDHVKYWRPQFLLLVRDPNKSVKEVVLANDMKKSGLLILGNIIEFQHNTSDTDQISEQILPKWLQFVEHLKVKSFVEITRARSVVEGFEQLARLSGLGGMKPNTLVISFFENQSSTENLNIVDVNAPEKSIINFSGYFDILRKANSMTKNVCIFRNVDQLEMVPKGFIDVWPVDLMENSNMDLRNCLIEDIFDATSIFSLQLACVLSLSLRWKKLKSNIRIMIPVPSDQWQSSIEITKKFEKYLSERLRIRSAIVYRV